MSRRRRTLAPEDQALWQAVARSVTPLHPGAPEGEGGPKAPDPSPQPDGLRPSAPAALSPFRIGSASPGPRAPGLSPTIAGAMRPEPLRMDARAYTRMTRGKLLPEARIDLHGMTLAEAHGELIRFIARSQAAGLRLVLVITGKGRAGDQQGPVPHRTGVLRHQVPHWLRLAPLAPLVQQVAQAHARHGGSGAFYVYLRRHP